MFHCETFPDVIHFLQGSVLQDLSAQISALQKQVDETETDLRDEKAAHDMSREELEEMKAQVCTLIKLK